MIKFDLRLLNFPAEKLLKPRKRLAGIEIPDIIKQVLAFKETNLEEINEESDIMIFMEYFNDLGFDNLADLKEFISTHELHYCKRR